MSSGDLHSASVLSVRSLESHMVGTPILPQLEAITGFGLGWPFFGMTCGETGLRLGSMVMSPGFGDHSSAIVSAPVNFFARSCALVMFLKRNLLCTAPSV